MIWQLFKRDPMWKPFLSSLVLLFGLLAAAIPRNIIGNSGLPGLELIPTAGIMAMMIGIHVMTVSQRAAFEAALPISAQALWSSRALTMLAAVWIPFVGAVACGIPLDPSLQSAAIFSVLAMAATFQIGPQRRGVKELRLAFLLVFLIPPATMFLQGSGHLAWPSVDVVVPICGVATTALFWRGWALAGTSPQIAARKGTVVVQGETAPPVLVRSEDREPSRFASSPIFRSIYNRPAVLMSAFIVGDTFFGQILTWSLLFALLTPRLQPQNRWLLNLPFSARRLFAWIAILPTTAVLIGCSAGILNISHPLSAKARIVEVSVELTFVYGLYFLAGLPAWRRLSRFSATQWGARIVWLPFVLAILASMFSRVDTRTMERLAGVAPENPWQLAALLLLPIVATYGLAEKAFREQEYRPTTVSQAAYAFRNVR